MSITVILGLRRSGTTIFWKWFRQDAEFTCFDEPFSEQLMRLPAEHSKGVFTEYRALVRRSPRDFWNAYAPVHRAEELDGTFTSRQREYLRFLAAQGENVVLDLTRCHLKVGESAQILPDANFIHLTRSERAFASSHLLPSRTDLRGRLERRVLERTFWTRSDRYDFWGMEALCGTGPGSKLSLLLDDAGYDVPAFYELPAVGRLIVLHRYLTRSAESVLESTGNSASVSFEDFASAPARTVDHACASIGAPAPVATGTVSPGPASPGHRPDDAKWLTIVKRVDALCPKETQ